jgi:hypothetical protein
VIKPEVLDAMVAAGCTAQQIAAAVKADIGTRSTNAERQARFRARHKASQSNESNVTGVTVTDPLSPKKEIPPTPPKEKTTPIPISSVGGAGAGEFDRFWADFPNKVGKRDAAKAFVGARQRADFETILAGVRRYSAKTDDRPWCNPSTFLNQDRWADDPAAPIATLPRSGAPPNRKRNFVDVARDRFRQQDDGPENLLGSLGNVELFPARLSRS